MILSIVPSEGLLVSVTATLSRTSGINWCILSYLGPTAVPEAEESDEALFCGVWVAAGAVSAGWVWRQTHFFWVCMSAAMKFDEYAFFIRSVSSEQKELKPPIRLSLDLVRFCLPADSVSWTHIFHQGKEMIELYFDFRLYRLWKTRQHSKLLDYEDLLWRRVWQQTPPPPQLHQDPDESDPLIQYIWTCQLKSTQSYLLSSRRGGGGWQRWREGKRRGRKEEETQDIGSTGGQGRGGSSLNPGEGSNRASEIKEDMTVKKRGDDGDNRGNWRRRRGRRQLRSRWRGWQDSTSSWISEPQVGKQKKRLM